MEMLLHSPATFPSPKQVISNGFNGRKGPPSILSNGYSSSFSLVPFASQKLPLGLRKSVIVWAKKTKNNDRDDSHGFILRPDETTGPFPEAVLFKEKKVQEDGRLLPDFADAEEEKLYESLNLQLQSQLKVEQMRHYEVVYLIHEKHAEEVGNVNEKVQDFLREKKGKIWRFSDWGMRRLAYKIQKAKNAHYILMNFELEAKWINDFKSMLDRDERVIRHLVIKMDEAVTEDCAPPPEFHTLRAGMNYDEEEDDFDYDEGDFFDDEAYEGEVEGYDENTEDGIIEVDSYDNEDDGQLKNNKSTGVISMRR
uniref:Uncharacterized protein n=1 Tax=Rhizophora mucronata TaxID=61149 RepID=A0A2P2NI43_RHIMU